MNYLWHDMRMGIWNIPMAKAHFFKYNHLNYNSRKRFLFFNQKIPIFFFLSTKAYVVGTHCGPL